MELFGKMELNTYLCRAKKERDGLRHQRYITQTGYRTLPEFAKKETLRIIPQQFQARQHDTVQLTYPLITGKSHEDKTINRKVIPDVGIAPAVRNNGSGTVIRNNKTQTPDYSRASIVDNPCGYVECSRP